MLREASIRCRLTHFDSWSWKSLVLRGAITPPWLSPRNATHQPSGGISGKRSENSATLL